MAAARCAGSSPARKLKASEPTDTMPVVLRKSRRCRGSCIGVSACPVTRRKTADAAEYFHSWKVLNRVHKSQAVSRSCKPLALAQYHSNWIASAPLGH